MKLRRSFALTKRALKQFRHDRRTLAFILFMPLLMIIIFGYTFSGKVNNIKIVILNNDKIASIDIIDINNVSKRKEIKVALAPMVIDKLDRDVFNIQSAPNDVNSAKKMVDDGDVWAAVIFPSNFSYEFVHGVSNNMQSGQSSYNVSANSIIGIYLDGSNPTIAGTIVQEINLAIIDAINDFAKQNSLKMNKPAVSTSQQYAYGSENMHFIDYFAPGVMAFAVMMVTTMITIIVFVQERSTGTLSRLLVSPATETEIVFGYAIAFGIIGIFQCLVVLAAAIFIFDVTVVGNVLLAFIIVVILGVGHQGLGIMLSAGAKNELQAIQFIPLILFPSILLAGLFWPVESIPAVLRPFSNFVPLTYAIDAMRAVMIKGWGVERIWIDLTALMLFAFLMLGAAILLLKRKQR